MVSGITANGANHCAIKNFNATKNMETQSKWNDTCGACYVWAYYTKIYGIEPTNKYYGQTKCSSCNNKLATSHGNDLTSTYKYIIQNNLPAVANVRASSDQISGDWVLLVGVSYSSYIRYQNNPSGFTASLSDFLIRDVWDGTLYGNASADSRYRGQTWELYYNYNPNFGLGQGVFYDYIQ